MFLPWLLSFGNLLVANVKCLQHCCKQQPIPSLVFYSLSLLFLSWYSGALLHVPSVNSLKHQACCLVAPVTVFSMKKDYLCSKRLTLSFGLHSGWHAFVDSVELSVPGAEWCKNEWNWGLPPRKKEQDVSRQNLWWLYREIKSLF